MVGGEAVSLVCEELRIARNLFYRWQKELSNHAAAFEVKGRGSGMDSRTRKLEKKVESLQAKLAHKDNVVAEVTEDCVVLEKGSSGTSVGQLQASSARCQDPETTETP